MECLTPKQIDHFAGDVAHSGMPSEVRKHICLCVRCRHEYDEAAANERALSMLLGTAASEDEERVRFCYANEYEVGMELYDEGSTFQGFVRHSQAMLRVMLRSWGLDRIRSRDVVREIMTALGAKLRRRLRSGYYGDVMGFGGDNPILEHDLLTLARRKFRQALRDQANAPIQPRENRSLTRRARSVFDEQAWGDVPRDEWRRLTMNQCLPQVRKEVEEPTFEAFQLHAIGGLSAEQVAKQLGIGVDAVYAAKKRVLSRVRELAKKQEQIS